MGVKITNKTQSTPQTGDELPINRAGADYKISPEDFPEYLYSQMMLKGDPEEIYVENTNDSATWQLGQKAASISTAGSSPVEGTVDCTQNDVFAIAPSTSEIEIQAPTNVPSLAQLGGVAAGTFYFRIYARNASSGSAGFLSFSSDWTKLPGSKPYQNTGTNRLNIIHCWAGGDGQYYYKIDNTQVDAEGQTQYFDVTIDNADVLTSNGTPLDILVGTTGGFLIGNLQFECALYNGSTPFDTNVNLQFFRGGSAANFIHDFDLSSTVPSRFNGDTPGSSSLGSLYSNGGDSLRAMTETGNPANGDYDLRVWGTYTIYSE